MRSLLPLRHLRSPQTEGAIFLPRSFIRFGAMAWRWREDVSRNGALGDARIATKEVGEKLNKIALDNAETMVRAVMARD